MMRRLTLVLVLLAACNGGGDTPEATQAAARPSSPAKVTIVAPEAGATMPAGSVLVKIDLQGGTIVAQASTDLKPDEGHLHLTLDGATVSMTYGTEQDVPDVKPGTHLLQAEFVAADHSPFNPRVQSPVVTFTAT